MRYAGLAAVFSLLAAASATAQAPQTSPAPDQSSSSQSSSSLNVNKTLFAVMVAANLSGYDAGERLLSNSAVRQKVRNRLANQKFPSLSALRSLLRDSRGNDSTAELQRYFEFAILSAGPPDFKPARSDLPRPPSLQALDDLPPLLADFYREAHLEDLWKELQPDFDSYLSDYAPAVRRALVQANAYLRMDINGYLGHRFLVWVEPLGEPNQVQTFAYRDDYNVLVTPAADVPTDGIRHAYLHYLLEPITTKYSAELQTKAALYDYTQTAPLVADVYKRSQWTEFATECFIKAVEAAIDHKPELVDEALQEGYILTPSFAQQLIGFEKQEAALRLYFPDMVSGIDVKKVIKSLAGVQFATERKVRTVQVRGEVLVAPPPLTGAAKTLEDAEKELNTHAGTDKQVDGAKELFSKALSESDQKPVHAKAYYGLARIAMVQNDLDEAERLYHKALDLDPDPVVKSWCFFYLGRLSDNMQDGRQQAQEFYKQSLAVEGAPEQVRKLAEQGLKQDTQK